MTERKLPSRAAIYVRISADIGGERAGVRRQHDDCQALAKRLGWTVVEIYEDNDISASTLSKKRRPEYTRLLADLKSGKRDGVLVYSLDRLTRRIAEFAGFHEALSQAGAALATTEGDDSTTTNGRMVINIKLAVAQQEAERISERVTRAAEQYRAEGRVLGGGRRFGFEPDNVKHRPSEVVVIREAAARVLTGANLGDLVRWLDGTGVLTVTGKGNWERITIKRILCSPRMIGMVEHRGQMTEHVGVWEPVLDRDTWEKVRLLIDPASRRRPPGWNTRKHLLSGIVICGHAGCGSKLVARPYYQGEKSRAGYVCSKQRRGCGKIKRNITKLDEMITELMIAYLEKYDPVLDVPDTLPLMQALDAAEDRVKKLHDAYAGGEVDEADFFPLLRSARDRVTALKGELSEATAGVVLASMATDNPRGRWEQATLSEKRTAIMCVMDSVVVKPVGKIGRRPLDLDSVEVVWRR